MKPNIVSMSSLRAFTFISVLVLFGCAKNSSQHTQQPEIFEDSYSLNLVWSAINPAQAYDANNLFPNTGWAKRTFDFGNNRLAEEQVICYPGGIKFHIERYVDNTGSWFRDLSGWRYGRYLLHGPEGTFDRYTQSLANGYLFLLDRPKIAHSQESLRIEEESTDIRVQTDAYQTLFSDIHKRNGLRYAKNASILREGRDQPTRRTILSFKPSSSVTRPTWLDTMKVQPDEEIAIETLAPNVHIIKGIADGRNVLAMLGENGWAIFGAPIHPDLSQATLDALVKKTGIENVETVFVSHAHGDHTGGIDYYIERGATLLVSDGVYEQLKTLRLNSIETVEVKTFKDVYRFDINGQKVEIHSVPNSHAKGLSFVFVPGLSLIYQGDFLSVPRDGTITYAMPITHELKTYLNNKGIRFSRMIGHHESADISAEAWNKILQNKYYADSSSPSCDAIAQMVIE